MMSAEPETADPRGRNERRRYLYAVDAVDAFDAILHKGRIESCCNIGSADEMTNIQVALNILNSFGTISTLVVIWINI